MDKLKVGVFISNFYNDIGGSFSYSEKLLNQIDKFQFDEKIVIIYVTIDSPKAPFLIKDNFIIPYSSINKNRWTFKNIILHKFFSLPIIKRLNFGLKIENKIRINIKKDIERVLINEKIDLLYYLTPNDIDLNYPYIMTSWDLGHKSMFAFPEVSMNGTFEKRESYHRITLQKAFAIFTESEKSKEELIHYERINKDRIFIVPLFAGNVINLSLKISEQEIILSKWNVKVNEYFFYPAQFWSHKNHYGLIHAFKKLLEYHQYIKLILSGSDKGNLSYIKKIIEDLNLQDKIIITGFVSDEEIYTFYENTIALVMPSYLGPTNMPLLEAYYLGCPVLCSNIDGHQQLMEDRAIYFDPEIIDDIYSKMNIQILKGRNKKLDIVPEKKQAAQFINEHLLKITPIRKTFGFNFEQY